MGQYFHINPMEWPMTIWKIIPKECFYNAYIYRLLLLHHGISYILGLKTQFGSKLVKLLGVDYPLKEMLKI